MPNGIKAQQYGLLCNEFILKIKSRDNRLVNIQDLMNKKVATILPHVDVSNAIELSYITFLLKKALKVL